jgi:hypothetical protein
MGFFQPGSSDKYTRQHEYNRSQHSILKERYRQSCIGPSLNQGRHNPLWLYVR